MFSQKIVESDHFTDMPLSSQALYFHLGMVADDDGFVNAPKKLIRAIGASEDDMKLLIAKRFILSFDSGVVVVKHWLMNNTIRKDRYNPTQYQDEMSQLDVKDNKSYTEKPLFSTIPDNGNQMATNGIPSGNQMATQYSIVEYSIVESSVVESTETQGPAPTPITYDTLIPQYGKAFVDERVERAKKYKNTNMDTVAKWCKEDYEHQKKTNSFNNFPQRKYDYDKLENDLLNSQAKKNEEDDP